MQKELIAPCGMNCGLCANFLAQKNDLKGKGVKMPYCTGCRIRDKQCAYIKKQCDLLLQQKIQFCYECSKFPCPHLQNIDKRYQERYHTSFIENLKFIKTHSLEAFMKKQEKQWRCEKCEELKSCHNGLCFHCDLEELKKKKNKYRWDES